MSKFGKELIESMTEACEHAEGKPTSVRVTYGRATPARKALLAYAEVWTCPILGNEDVRVLDRLFKEAGELARDVAVAPDDPPGFARWLNILRESPRASDAWEDALHEIADYFGLSTEK